ncbi:MAG: F0F1 ATP synthase subunit A [Desulfarculales bacterium]|jgi:F-type H+-transporting ATPase subunit a|nr:F0F1 ATP synthase subunit A [Desulfarculales bacterium]
MEHPFLILPWLLERIGLGEFAHTHIIVIYAWLAILFLLIGGKLCVRRLTMTPGKAQNFIETVIGGIEDFLIGIMGEKGRPFYPLIATLFIYILTMNWMGQIPSLTSPSANLNTTVPMAILVFCITHVVGVKTHGAHYIKQFMGPVWWLVPLMMPIEIISHLARILSLSFRLFGNLMGEELVVAVVLMLAGYFLIPVPLQLLFFCTGALQAFIFALLAMIYIGAAMEEAH